MKIAIYGAGALGTVIGAFIARAGYTVDLITRNRDHLRGLQQHGAHITGTVEMTVPVNAYAPEEMGVRYDFIFLLTKQQDNETVVRMLAHHLAPDGALCTFQNGLPEQLISSIIGPEKTFGCTVGWGATLSGNGTGELTSDPQHMTFELGQYGAHVNTARLGELRGILESAGRVTVVDDFAGARWSKLLINCSFSALSALLGCTLGEVVRRKKARDCVRCLLRECISVAGANGVDIPMLRGPHNENGITRSIEGILSVIFRRHRHLTASLLHDLRSGKATEVEFINGTVRDRGGECHVPTPFCEKVIEIIHAIEGGTLKTGFDNVRLFDDLT